MIEGESHSIKPKSSKPHLMNKLRVICAIAGEWGKPTPTT
jgi:hypothetical protein